MGSNIESGSKQAPAWDPQNVTVSLQQIYNYAETQAKAAIDWYYAKKGRKAIFSRFLRLATIVFTAIGGIVPIVSSLVFTATERNLKFNILGYTSVALAAFFLAMDRFSGSSTGWMRFISTAMSLETLLEEFRLDWVKLKAEIAGGQPDAAHIAAFLNRLKSFTLAVRSQVEKETQAWIAEFQSNLSQLEKDTKQALDAAREEVRKQLEAVEAGKREAAQSQRPGAINLTVSFVVPLDKGFSVEIDGKVYREHITGNACGIVGVGPGLHELVVKAVSNGKQVQVSKVIEVKGNEITPMTIDLK